MSEHWSPMDMLESNNHLTIIGGTRSGKTNAAIYYSKVKQQQGRRIIFITAKPESNYRGMFDKRYTDDVDGAMKSLIKEPNKSVLLEMDINNSDEVGRLLDGIGLYLRQNMEKKDKDKTPAFTVFVDEISLLVRNKGDTSDTNVSLTRASATWMAYDGQLVSIAQRSSMIHHTVLTQSDLLMFQVPKGDLSTLRGIVYPDLQDGEITNYLETKQYHSVFISGFDVNYLKPVPLQQVNRDAKGLPNSSPP